MSLTDIAPILDMVEDNLSTSLEKLMHLMSFRSISSDPDSREDIANCANWLAQQLSELGLDAQVIETEGHPVVLGRSEHRARRPKVLFYGHYDVQPAEPLDAWRSAPFEPALREENGLTRIYGRGASDSKSQLWSVIEALRAWKETEGEWPVNVTILLEGEEEYGSPSLPAFIQANRDMLSCDIAFNSDSDMWSPTRPAITTRLKGLVHEKVTILAPNDELHSGHFGNVVANPIRVLIKILNSIHDDHGRVAVEGFYDGVEPIAPELRHQWEALDVSEALAGVSTAGGSSEEGIGPVELMWSCPGIDLNGIWGGNTGPTERSVLPASASARLTFRLVGKQRPDHVRAAFRRFVENSLPEGCRAEFEGSGGSRAVAVNEASPYIATAERALNAEWPEAALIKGTGGAVPVVGWLSEYLGMDCVTVGFILSDDAIHAPNERFDVERLRKAIRSWVRILAELPAIAADGDSDRRTSSTTQRRMLWGDA